MQVDDQISYKTIRRVVAIDIPLAGQVIGLLLQRCTISENILNAQKYIENGKTANQNRFDTLCYFYALWPSRRGPNNSSQPRNLISARIGSPIKPRAGDYSRKQKGISEMKMEKAI